MAHDDENELSCSVSRDVELARYSAALQAGIERDDAGMIAHNLLGHASMVEENAHASPRSLGCWGQRLRVT
jgi:hypothetical protein